MKDKKLTTGYISSFCMELYLILQAGIPLSEGMEILSQSQNNDPAGDLLQGVAERLYQGDSLQMALEHGEAFPRYMVDMIGVGEQTGNLDRSLKGLATYYTRQEQLEQNIRKAVLYPAVLLVMLTMVLVVLIVEVLPMFNDVYNQLGGTLAGLGSVILNFGIALRTHWLLAIGVVLALGIGAVILGRNAQKDGKRVLLSKKLGWAVATSKLASALAMAMQSGLDTDMAMEMALNLTQHPQLRSRLERCRTQMAEGEAFALALGQEAIFSSLHCRMLEVGMRTGAMDEVMEDIARRSDSATQDAVDRYIGSVEPTLVMVMSLLVGVVLLSVMLPLASIMTALG